MIGQAEKPDILQLMVQKRLILFPVQVIAASPVAVTDYIPPGFEQRSDLISIGKLDRIRGLARRALPDPVIRIQIDQRTFAVFHTGPQPLVSSEYFQILVVIVRSGNHIHGLQIHHRGPDRPRQGAKFLKQFRIQDRFFVILQIIPELSILRSVIRCQIPVHGH